MDIQGSLILADGLLRLAHRLPSARHAWQLTGRLWTQHLVKRGAVQVAAVLVGDGVAGFARHDEQRIYGART